MKKSFEKAETFGKKILNLCCYGNSSGVYGFSNAYSRAATTQLNLIEPYFDDVMQPICDNFHVEMFVYFFMCFSFTSSQFKYRFSFSVPKILICFNFAIDTFWGEKAEKMNSENAIKSRKERKN